MFSKRTIHGQRYEDYAAGVRGWHFLGSEACEEKGSSCEPYAADCPSPVTYADARNLCRKRRDGGGVKVADTPQTQNGMVPGLSSPHVGKRCPQGTRRRGGSYGLLYVCCTGTGELPHRFTYVVGHENASVREGGRRWRSSPKLGCNGLDMVKVRQAWCTEPTEQTRTWGPFTRGSL